MSAPEQLKTWRGGMENDRKMHGIRISVFFRWLARSFRSATRLAETSGFSSQFLRCLAQYLFVPIGCGCCDAARPSVRPRESP
ncbi:hypothetical protein WBP06_00625 [Novosphingobium sp. BL-8H]|uniref:hypothetical protein n=1 Tax=Novosphingobium sp. BL-8H TaxID=3127640 RepID=UPI0037576C31